MALSMTKNANLALSFFLELGVLFALGYWGFITGSNLLMQFVFGLGAPIAAIIVWAFFGARTSSTRLRGLAFLTLQVIFFGSAVVALFFAKQPVLSAVFALAVVLNLILAYTWSQQLVA